PTQSGSRTEANRTSDIPRVVTPVSFRPIIDRSEPFHRPVWFGAVPGEPGASAVIEMQKSRVWILNADGRERRLFVDILSETIAGEITGLTSLAFHPDFVHNGRYFLKMHVPREGGRLAVRIVERKAAHNPLRDSGEPSKPVLEIPVFSEIHN